VALLTHLNSIGPNFPASTEVEDSLHARR
jgi:hypothetical protein